MRLKKRPVLLFLPLILSLLVLSLSIFYNTVGLFVSEYIAPVIRRPLAEVSSRFGFSIFEICVLLSPIIIYLIVRYIIKGNGEHGKRFVASVAIISIVCSVYIITILIPTLSRDRGDSPNVTEEEICSAAEILISEISSLDKSQNSPRGIYEIFDDARKICSEKLHGWLPVAKPLISSGLFSRLGILGLYSFPTSEININVEIPSYMIPFAVLHEYAHYLGIMDEGEANFHAFLVAYNANETYIRYSASLCALEYILLDLEKYDVKKYANVYNMLDCRVRSDLKEYRIFLAENSGSPAYTASEGLHGALSGSQSYSELSRYVTRYLLSA